jgi:pantetheine-phosphate adenylyltransferase
MSKIKAQRKHWWVALGGTFDHFHSGHEQFLKFSAQQGENLLIGVTAQHLTTSKKLSHSVETYRVRTKSVAKWCQKNQVSYEIFPLYDLYGPTLSDKRIQALAVTQETIKGADLINQARVASGNKELPVYICPMFLNNLNKPLHSDQIRSGTTSRNGVVYMSYFNQDIKINSSQKKFFSKPIGEIETSGIFDSNEYSDTLFSPIVVGDRSLLMAIDQKVPVSIAVVDNKIERQKISTLDNKKIENYINKLNSKTWHTVNKAGCINLESVVVIKKIVDFLLSELNFITNKKALAFENYKQIAPTQKIHFLKVVGEEDLLTAVLVLALPLKSVLYYGQPKKGLVKLTISENLKNKVFNILFN